ncbi:type I secretion system permease/ATPase [Sphingopyxis sp. LARHCG72]
MTHPDAITGRPPRFAGWLMEPMRRNRPTYLKVALAAAMINIFGLVTSLFTMTVYDRVVPNNATSSLIALTIGLVIVIIFDFALRTLRAYFVDIAGAEIDHEVAATVFQRLLALRLETRRGSTGALTAMMRELETLRDFFASATLTAIVDVPFILVTLALTAAIGGIVAIVPIIMIPLVVLVGWLTHPALDRLSARAMSGGLLKQSVLVETIGGLEMIKSAGAGPLLAGRWARAVNDHAEVSLRQRLVASVSINFASSANVISYAGVVIVGVGLIAKNELTMGGLIACSILAGRALAPLGQIAQLLSRLTATQTAYRQLEALMATPPEGPANSPIRPSKIEGRIEFRNLAFRYPGASERALDGVSFSIASGEHVALLGRVGSGKSTVARLILGLYPPEQGLVMVDGNNIHQFDPAELRANIGAVLQDSALLSGTVRENIALGRMHVDDEELIRVARISGTHEFMGQLANGYDLQLADRGESLSGGQRQSIAIARALAGRPPILLFDEPSSAMDAQTEAGLLQRMGAELKGRTALLITHRPPLLQLVSRIILLDRGRLVADGPRDSVLEQLRLSRGASLS